MSTADEPPGSFFRDDSIKETVHSSLDNGGGDYFPFDDEGATATAATKEDPTSTTQTIRVVGTADDQSAPMSPTSLLRHWNPELLLVNSPPVAPAIVMDDRATSGGRTHYYPVATAVGGWVRRNVGQTRSPVTIHSIHDQHHPGAGGGGGGMINETLPLSVRSVADLPSDLQLPNAAGAAAGGRQMIYQHYSAPFVPVNGDLDKNTEYILVGGEMIQVPIQPPSLPLSHHQHGLVDDLLRDQLHRQEEQDCQPREVKSRIRRISKWFKRVQRQGGGGRRRQDHAAPTSDTAMSVRPKSLMESSTELQPEPNHVPNSAAAKLPPDLSGPAPPSSHRDSQEHDKPQKGSVGKKSMFRWGKKSDRKSPPRSMQHQQQPTNEQQSTAVHNDVLKVVVVVVDVGIVVYPAKRTGPKNQANPKIHECVVMCEWWWWW
jgi:hypothetical protein